MKGGAISAVVLVLFAVKVLVRLGNSTPDVDTVIKQNIINAKSEIDKIKASPEYSDARCYRDGSKKGIVLEFIFSKEHSPEEMDGELMKTFLKQDLAQDKEIKAIADLGIYFKYIYKDHTGKELCTVSILPSDF